MRDGSCCNKLFTFNCRQLFLKELFHLFLPRSTTCILIFLAQGTYSNFALSSSCFIKSSNASSILRCNNYSLLCVLTPVSIEWCWLVALVLDLTVLCLRNSFTSLSFESQFFLSVKVLHNLHLSQFIWYMFLIECLMISGLSLEC